MYCTAQFNPTAARDHVIDHVTLSTGHTIVSICDCF